MGAVDRRDLGQPGPGSAARSRFPPATPTSCWRRSARSSGSSGVAVVVALYAILSWRCLRVAIARAGRLHGVPRDRRRARRWSFRRSSSRSGLLGLFPLAGVVTPFLSYGRSSMLANCFAVGDRAGGGPAARARCARHLHRPIRDAGRGAGRRGTLAIVEPRRRGSRSCRADAFATASSLSEQADGGYRFEYNPRLIAAARLIERGTIYDRNGLALATSRPRRDRRRSSAAYRKAGVDARADVPASRRRALLSAGRACMFSVLGDWDRQTNWGGAQLVVPRARQRRAAQGLRRSPAGRRRRQPADRRARAHRSSATTASCCRWSARARHRRRARRSRRCSPGRATCHPSIDARLQAASRRPRCAPASSAAATRAARPSCSTSRAGEVLASVSYPWPADDGASRPRTTRAPRPPAIALLDRARYGLYPPGSTFKLLVAGAALRSQAGAAEPDVRVRPPAGRPGRQLRARIDAAGARRSDGHGAARRRRPAARPGRVVQRLLRAAGAAPRAAADPRCGVAVPDRRGAAGHRRRRCSATLAHAGYGQADVLVSPLKMARVAAAIAGARPACAAGAVDARSAAAGRRARSSASCREADAATLSRYMRERSPSGTGRTLRRQRHADRRQDRHRRSGRRRARTRGSPASRRSAARRRIAFAVHRRERRLRRPRRGADRRRDRHRGQASGLIR